MSDTFGVTEQLRQNTVVTSAGRFEEHPESYRPRVFVRTEHGAAKVYELLQDGQAVTWPKVPDPNLIGNFWLINADGLKDMVMRRPGQ